MPLTSPNYTDVFSDMGKIIKVYNLLDDSGPTVQTAIVEMVEQLDRNYQNCEKLSSMLSNAVTARNSMASGATNMISAMSTYLLGPLKSDITSVATTAGGVLDDLITLMGTDAETVLTAGVFYTFFDDNYDKQLPTSGTPTIADTLAT